MNLCIDHMLWRLVDRSRIQSLSYLSADPQWSLIADEVKGHHLNHALVEEIVPLNPDLILAGEFDAPDAILLFKKLNQPIVQVKIPQTLADIHQQWITLADLVGEQLKATELTQQLQQDVEQLKSLARQHNGLRVFWYSANGVVVGKDTLEDELLTLAGLRNIAAENNISGFTPLDLELLLTEKPDALIVEASQQNHYSLAKEFLFHPAIEAHHIQLIELPAQFSSCSTDMLRDFAQSVQSYFLKEQ